MDLKNVEIMSVVDNVDNRGYGFSLDDLKGIATSFTGLSLDGRVPLKFGHNDAQPMLDGQPALGWVSRVWVEGERLLADFKDLPTVVYDAIKKGLYKNVSVELLKNVQAGTRVIPWVLDAVALLGADQPAFGNLRDLQSLTLSKWRRTIRTDKVVRFTREKFNRTTEDTDMTEDEVKAIVAKQVGEVTTKFTTELNTVKADAQKQLDAANAALKTEQVKNRRSAITEKFNVKIAEGSLTPASFTMFESMTRMKDDEAVLKIEDAIVEQFIKDNSKAVKKPAAATSGGTEEASEEGLTVNEVFAQRKAKYMRDNKLDPKKWEDQRDAGAAVLKADPKLGESYRYARLTEVYVSKSA